MMTNRTVQIAPVRCASLEFDLELGLVTNSHGESQRFSPINLKLLAFLFKHHGQVVSRTELFEAIWPNQLLSEDVLTRAVSDIRTQLAKLDVDTKFIETLPKRGYRWLLDVHPLASPEANKPDIEQVHAVPESPHELVSPAKSWVKILSTYLSLAIILALGFMWAISQSRVTAISIAVLPTVVSRPAIEPLAQAVDEALLNVLRKNTKVKLLSSSAISSRPKNPFPYFANEFGATWVVESRVTDLDGINNIELSLVDARTGIELRNLKFEIANRADIVHMVAQKLEPELLVESSLY